MTHLRRLGNRTKAVAQLDLEVLQPLLGPAAVAHDPVKSQPGQGGDQPEHGKLNGQWTGQERFGEEDGHGESRGNEFKVHCSRLKVPEVWIQP